MVKSLRFKHYSYLVLALLLVVLSIGNIIASLRTAKASEGTVTITSPTASQEINQSTRQITGTAPALKEVAVFDGTTKLGTTTASAGGTWSLQWEDPVPGQHSLRATVTNGTMYNTKLYSRDSLESRSINSGQVTHNFAADLSGTTGVVFDEGLQKTFAINYLAGTVTQINAVSETVEDTIVYDSTAAEKLGVSAGPYQSLCAANDIVRTVCAYTYSQQAHKLYIFNSTKLFIINTQSKALEATVTMGGVDEYPYEPSDIGYKLYVDQQGTYLYVYHKEGGVGVQNHLVRVNLQTNTLDGDWTKTSNGVVVSAAGDIFYSGSQIQVIRANATDPEVVSVADGSCANGATQLAMAKDESYLYAACKDASDNKKTVAISLEDGQLAASFDRDGDFLNEGNLTSSKLLIATQSDDSIQVLNTSSNTLSTNIQSIVGARQKHSIQIDGTNEKAYFTTLDSDNSLNHVYEIDLSNSGVLHDYTYPLTDFSGTRAAALSSLGTYILIPTEANESVHTISLSNGAHSVIEQGVGSALAPLYSPATERIFTLPYLTSIGYTNKVSVVSAADNTFVQKVSLPGNYSVMGIALNQTAATLYVMGVDFGTTGVGSAMKIFAIDANTLQVTRIYNSLDQYAPQSINAFQTRNMAVYGDKLAYIDYTAGSEKIYQLNLESDTVLTSDLNPVNIQNSSLSGGQITKSIAFNSDGTKLAVVRDGAHISVRNSADLSESQLITTTGWPVNIAFDEEGNIIASTFGAISGNSINIVSDAKLIVYNSLSREVIRESVLENTLSGASVSTCLPVSQDVLSNPNIAVVVNGCTDLNAQENTSLSVSVVELSTGLVLHTKEISSQDSFGGFPTTTSAEVLSVTQNVIVRADAVSVTSPSEGQQFSAGTHTIVGTAPSNATVTVSVDGQVIGVAQSDEYGAWQLDHEFRTAKSYKITAENIKPSRQVMYIPSISFNGSAFQGKVNIFNTAKDKMEESFDLPDGYLPIKLEVSNDKTKLYVLAAKLDLSQNPPTSEDLRLFTIDATTHAVLQTADMAGSADETGVFSQLLLSGLIVGFSEDQQQVYLLRPNGLSVYNSNGSLEKTIPVTVTEEDGSGFHGILIAENANRAYIFTDKTGIIINLTTDEVTRPPALSEGTSILTAQYDSQNQQTVVVVNDGQNTTIVANPTGNEGASPNWYQEFPNTFITPANTLSSDGRSMFLLGVNTDTYSIIVIEIQLQNGDYVIHGTPATSEFLLYSQALSAGAPIYSLRLDASNKKIYMQPYVTTNPAATGKMPVVDFSGTTTTKMVSFTESGLINFYPTSNNKVSTEIAGTTLSAERNFAIVAGSTNTETPPVAPPVNPPTTPPSLPQPLAEPVVVTAAAQASKKQLITKAEKRALQRAPFANLFAGTRRLFRGLPRPFLKALPYALYTIILALSGYYLYQTQEQLRREDRMRKILTKQKVLTEEKRNFLDLTSHYLRTPLTYIRSGAEMSERKGQSKQLASDLSQAVNHLSLFVESLIEEAGIQKNSIEEREIKIQSPLLSRNFLFPALGLTVTVGLFYVIASGVAGIRFENTTYLTHLILVVLILRLFYGMIKNHRLVVAESQKVKETLDAERALDRSRSKLLEDAGEQLQTRTEHIAGLSAQLSDDETSKKIIEQGVERLQELARAFMLVCKLEAEALVVQMKPVSVHQIATEVIEPFSAQIAEKELTLTVTGFEEKVTMTTNRPLAELTLKSLVENAIQASKPGDSLLVKCLSSDGHVAFQVIDHGKGIPKEKVSQLFKPFVRVGPVTTFNREGIGLSLFLDRLIMHSLGGEVEIMSKLDQGTVATLTFAQKPTV